MTIFSHLHLNSYLSIQTCTQICIFRQSHHFGKCSHIMFEHRRLCHLMLIDGTFSPTNPGAIAPPPPKWRPWSTP